MPKRSKRDDSIKKTEYEEELEPQPKIETSSRKFVPITRISYILIGFGLVFSLINLIVWSPALWRISAFPFPTVTNTKLPPTIELVIPSRTSTPDYIPEAVIPTPHTFIFDGYINCRANPSTSSPVITVISGERITIDARDSDGLWLLVSVSGTSSRCWIYRNALGLAIDISRIPVYPGSVIPTPITPAISPYPTYTPLPTYTPFPTLTSEPSAVPTNTVQSPSAIILSWLTALGPLLLGSLTLIFVERIKINGEIHNNARRLDIDERRINAEIAAATRKLECDEKRLDLECKIERDKLRLEESKLNLEREIEMNKLGIETSKLDFEKQKDELNRKSKLQTPRFE